jgi:heme-degrading monooxygenase HmoA
MIGRVWRGWADETGATAYEAHFREEVQGALAAVPGCHGGYLLRHDSDDGVEFVTLTLFDSLDAVRAFAGEGYEQAVVAPAAQAALRDYERTVRHYTIVAEPGTAPSIPATRRGTHRSGSGSRWGTFSRW